VIRFAILFVCVVLCVPAFGQEFLASEDQCYIDPITKRQVCPLKKAAAVTGAVVSKVGAVITPNDLALPVQPMQVYSAAATFAPVQTYQYQSAQSYGWSKSWHTVPKQPVRNLGRRLLGR
jgi:hypothetical protein